MAKQAKNLHLDEDVIKILSVQAIEKGFKNFKNYAEHLLITQSGKK